jgi:hypothetical protein
MPSRTAIGPTEKDNSDEREARVDQILKDVVDEREKQSDHRVDDSSRDAAATRDDGRKKEFGAHARDSS